MNKPKVVIIGAGVIGLSIGWRLAQKGFETTIFDKGIAGGEASSAAAGMITPVSELRFGEESLLKLFLKSLALYPDFVSELEREAAQSIDFNRSGSYVIAIDPDDEAELERIYDYQKSLDLPVSRVSPACVAANEPLLTTRFHAALEAKGECFLDNRLMVAALKKAFRANGGILCEQKPVTGLNLRGNRIGSVMAGGEIAPADIVILASGIHADIEGLPDQAKIPIRPVKGQALDLMMSSSPSLGRANRLNRAVRTIHRYPVYLVPRADGRITIGATNEEMGSDSRVTGGALLDLLSGAWKILPAIEEMEFASAWSGHRAATPDHAPVIGPTGVKGLFHAMGFYRHGFLLAPITAKVLSDLIVEGRESPYLREFGAQRFRNREHHELTTSLATG